MLIITDEPDDSRALNDVYRVTGPCRRGEALLGTGDEGVSKVRRSNQKSGKVIDRPARFRPSGLGALDAPKREGAEEFPQQH